MSRFALNISSNAMLEVQWYMFSAIFMLCSGYVLNKNEHIRIDVVTGRFSARTQNWIDVFGILVFLLPMAVLLAHLSLAAIHQPHGTRVKSPRIPAGWCVGRCVS